jgi:hypothetical protein
VGEHVGEIGAESGMQEPALPPPYPAVTVAHGVPRGVAGVVGRRGVSGTHNPLAAPGADFLRAAGATHELS